MKPPEQPSSAQNDSLTGKARDEAIERLYDVALDPTRYEMLLDVWETAVAPLRETADFSAPRLLDDPAIASHFDRAGAFLDRLDQSSTQAQLDAALAPFDKVAAFLFGDDHKVAAANPAAQARLGLRVGKPLSQMSVNSEDIESVITTAHALLKGKGEPAAVLRLRSRARGHFVILRLQVTQLGTGGQYILAASSEVSCPKGFSDILKRAFDLTTAEADVVRSLVECCSVKDIAEQRGRSIDTVRAQIRSILSKTETRSQVELVRLALSLMDMSNLTIGTTPGPRRESRGYATLRPRPYKTLITPDGRRLDYLTLGLEGGAPLLFLPLDYGLVRWPASAEAEAARRGIRVIVPVRAGFGQSDMVARDQDYDALATQDTLQILDAEGVTRCPIISLGADSFYAMKLAHRDLDRIAAIIAAGGVLPMTRRAQYERMEKWHRFILAGAKYTPHLLPFMVKSGFYLARKIGKRGFIHAVYGNCPADVDTFENPEVLEAMVTGSETALADDHSAHQAFSRMVLGGQTGDWTDLVAALKGRLPVVFFNGTQDPQVPLGTLEEFRRDHDWIDFRVHDDAGQLIFFRHWQLVLDEVEKYIAR
ncbi:LuxR C-terminal-related transcriptional regulator [uncultured Aliiroseovarius sp.]|uniref:LuxR C-terminal-related transcriptional regulator n=1 Tax=uncultured Aliiroseovarius sp. TaxID=1658783 RepID=UPI00259A761F|nr:LuxR C-terminal-related transcriptional regulator [uncultured Aliiroseovarius sp.]